MFLAGPTSRDMHDSTAAHMSAKQIHRYIIKKCQHLVPAVNATTVIHGFAGARAKSSTGDWVIGSSMMNKRFINCAGIDSPGLAASPAIADDICSLLVEMSIEDDLQWTKNPSYSPKRRPIIVAKKVGGKGLKYGGVDTHDVPEVGCYREMLLVCVTANQKNVICKCEKVTEAEVVDAIHRSIPIDNTQAVRKRTRAGMGHCQGSRENYDCEHRVACLIARERGIEIDSVGRRGWPGTSTLPKRWLTDTDKNAIADYIASALQLINIPLFCERVWY